MNYLHLFWVTLLFKIFHYKFIVFGIYIYFLVYNYLLQFFVDLFFVFVIIFLIFWPIIV